MSFLGNVERKLEDVLRIGAEAGKSARIAGPLWQ